MGNGIVVGGCFGRSQNSIFLGGHVFSWFLRRYNNFLMGGLCKWFCVCFRVEFNCLTYRNMPTTIARSVEGFLWLLIYLLTYSTEQSPSWEANQFAASQEMPPHFMEPEGSSPHSQVPATCPYPEPAWSSPYPPHPTSWRSILILSHHLRLVLPSGLFQRD